jgi:hypothetical protein
VDFRRAAYDAVWTAGSEIMSAVSLIVCEKMPRFAPALRTALGDRPIVIVELRGLAQCETAAAGAPASLLAVEVTATNLTAVIDLMDRIGQRFSQLRWAALISPEHVAVEPLLREAGAIDVLRSTLEAPRLARLARRHLDLAPAEEFDLHESIDRRMPWHAYRVASA